ncbi:MAG TPA: hypothetical protein DEH25_07740 [Chloroflexi bacterium]|nr:hypothetical protein [Chloroflexota bacterium]
MFLLLWQRPFLGANEVDLIITVSALDHEILGDGLLVTVYLPISPQPGYRLTRFKPSGLRDLAMNF